MANPRRRISKAERKFLTAKRLRELVSYDPDTGIFTRIAACRPQSRCYINQPVGVVKKGGIGNGGGYLIISVDGAGYRAHRLAWLYMTGSWPDRDIDHRDGDRLNNKWSNLRAASRSENIHNIAMRPQNTSGRKGATWDASRQKWMSQITVNGKHIHLGRFDTKEEAGDAYDRAAEQYFGEFARVA